MGTKLSTLGTDTKESKMKEKEELRFQYKLKQADKFIAELDIKICECEEGEDSSKLLRLEKIHEKLITSSEKIRKKMHKISHNQFDSFDIVTEFREKQLDISTLNLSHPSTKLWKLKERRQKLIKQKEQWIYENTPEGKRDLQNQNEQQYLKFERERKLESEHEEFWRRNEIQERQLFNKWGRCPICHKMLGPFMAKYEQFNDNFEDYQINHQHETVV